MRKENWVESGNYVVVIDRATLTHGVYCEPRVEIQAYVAMSGGRKGPRMLRKIDPEGASWRPFLLAIQRAGREQLRVDLTQAWLNHNIAGARGWALVDKSERTGLNSITRFVDAEFGDPYSTLKI